MIPTTQGVISQPIQHEGARSAPFLGGLQSPLPSLLAVQEPRDFPGDTTMVHRDGPGAPGDG